MLLAFGVCSQSPLTCLLSASTIHHQELVLSKKRRKKKSTKLMMAGLIPSKIQALSMEVSVRQMPHWLPSHSRLNRWKDRHFAESTWQKDQDQAFPVHLTTALELNWETVRVALRRQVGKKMASKTKHCHCPGLNTTQSGPPWSWWFVSLDADFLTCHLWTELWHTYKSVFWKHQKALRHL